MKILVFIMVGIFCFQSLKAQYTDTSSKKKYSLFHPLPRQLMRDFSTDRPDVTESPYTVDAGHFQLETDILKVAFTNTSTEKIKEYSWNAINLKMGVSNSTDLQVAIESYKTAITRSGGVKETEKGVGNLTLRIKQNIFGNDKGSTALAFLPFVDIPLHKEENISGGIALPFAFSAGKGWEAGLQGETDFEKNIETGNINTTLLTSFTAGHSLAKKLDFFMETVGTYTFYKKNIELFLNTGAIYNLSNNLKFDAGINYGVKKESAKIFLLGFSFRR